MNEWLSTPMKIEADQSYGESARRVPARIRKQRVTSVVKKVGFITVPDIAAELAVSEMTIRRDLIELEREGLIMRTRGGALAPEPRQIMDREEPKYEARLRLNQAAKQRIAAAAYSVIGDARTIVLDVGTTTYHLASLIAGGPDVKTFTNSMRIATLLASGKQDVYVPAGPVRSDELSICGPAAVSHFGRLHFDIAFIGVSGVSPLGLFDYSIEEAEMKRVFIKQSARRVVVCDATKFDRMSLVQIAAMNEIDMLITDAEPQGSIGKALKDANVALLIAPPLDTHS
jgi:DeoR/GlpR family transcriptional regulator of sugar metabolism